MGLLESGKIVDDNQDLAFIDQIIYRFSKLQDIMGAKLFKSYLAAQGENVDKPFLDILNQLEKLNILEVDEWFELRDIRNSIAHHCEEDVNVAVDLINLIYKTKKRVRRDFKDFSRVVVFKDKLDLNNLIFNTVALLMERAGVDCMEAGGRAMQELLPRGEQNQGLIFFLFPLWKKKILV